MFDPKEELKQLQASYGVPRLLSANLQEDRKKRTLGNGADEFLSDAVRCILAGWMEPVPELLTRAKTWSELAHSTTDDEHHYDNIYAQGYGYRTLGLSRWLLQDAHDSNCFRESVRLFESYYSEKANLDRSAPDFSLADYVNAQAYEQAISLYQRSGRKPPTTARRAIREGCVAYVVARHRLHDDYPEKDVRDSLEALFKRTLTSAWLAGGHYSKVAVWMKIAFWTPGASAVSAVLRCYDFITACVGKCR